MSQAHLGSALLMLSVALCGCDRLWLGSTRRDPQNCFLDRSICSAQQRCNLSTELCEPIPPTPDMAMLPTADMAGPLPAPPSQIFPHGPTTAAPSGGTTSGLSFPLATTFLLAAIGTARMYYTVDGSQPMLVGGTTLSGNSVLSLGTLNSTTTVRFFADYGAGYLKEPVNDFTFTLNSTTPTDYDSIPEAISFDPAGGPVIVTTPGADVTGHSNFRAWRSIPTGTCASCALQYVITVETKGSVGCVDSVDTYGIYPGSTGTANFSFKAPLQPGRYRVYAGLAYQASCDGISPSGPDIGSVVVN